MRNRLWHKRIIERAAYWIRMPDDVLARLLLAIPFVIMILLTGLSFRLIGDEGFFHIKVINTFAASWPIPNIADYSSASTPLPYLLWTIFGKVFGFEIWKLRFLSVLATYLGANLFYSLGKRHNLPYPLLSTFILLFFPYIFFHSFTVYTVSVGLLFGIWTLHYYLLDEPSHGQLLIGSLLATLAIYCRQYYCVLPIGMLLFELFKVPKQNFVLTLKQRFWRWAILLLPIILVSPLFFLWRGLTPPLHQTDHFVHPILQHLNFFPIFIGFYFLPMFFSSHTNDIFRYRKVVLLAFVILLPLYFLFPIVYSEEPNRIGAMTGVIAHGLDISGKLIGTFLAKVGKFGLWIAGLLIILGALISRPWNAVKSKIVAFLAAFLILISLTPYVAERYITLTVPFLVLLLHGGFRHRRLLFFWLIIQIAISVIFSYWQIAIKSF